MSPLRWTTSRPGCWPDELTRPRAIRSRRTLWVTCCGRKGSACRATPRPLRVRQHPDRDAQFRYINEQARAFQDGRGPGDQRGHQEEGTGRGLRERRAGVAAPRASPVPVRTHDFPDEDLGKAIPYGVYDVAADAGWVNVGTDHDTAAFAVESIRRWWKAMGRAAYPHARQLLITADGGGCNGYRTRAWKAELAALRAETGLPSRSATSRRDLQVEQDRAPAVLPHHDELARPPAGQPRGHRRAIAATTTRTGLTVRAELDPGSYPDRGQDQRRADGRPAAGPATTCTATGTTPCAPSPPHRRRRPGRPPANPSARTGRTRP